MRFVNVEYDSQKIIIKRSSATLRADIISTLLNIVVCMTVYFIGFEVFGLIVPLSYRVIISQLSPMAYVMAVVLLISLIRALICFICTPDYIIDLANEFIYSKSHNYGSLDDVSDLRVETYVPNRRKVKYRVVIVFKSGKFITLAVTPGVPNFLSANHSVNYSPWGFKEAFQIGAWSTSIDLMDVNDTGYQEMREFQIFLVNKLAEYKSGSNAN